VLLLLLADDIAEARGWRQLWFTLVASVGLLGLLTTFSRSAWLAFGLGLVAWFLRRTVLHPPGARSGVRQSLVWQTQYLVPSILAALFLSLQYDLVASRFLHLETPLEARSIHDRQRDADLAIQLIRDHPWRGVGVRNYLVAVRAIEPDSRTVHNVPLLTAAELGLPGAALWLWLAVTGFTHPMSAAWPPWSAMLVTNLFDIALSITNSWYATIVFALVAAYLSLPCRAAQGASIGNQRRPCRDRGDVA
jgi:O-antigen ligase